jgi:putative oxidoreductase
MAPTTPRVDGWAPWIRSVLRIVAAFLFMQFGSAKLIGFPGPILPGGGTVAAWTLAWFAGVLEVVGGALVLVGLFTRPVAFILSGEMAVAYFLAHAPRGFWPVLNEGHPAVLFCFVWLYFAAAGAGPLSVDAVLGRSPKGSGLI